MRRSTWILLAVVAGLVAVILLWERHQPTTQQAEENRSKLWALDTKEVTGAARSGASPLSLQKGAEDSWRLTAPTVDLADRYGVEGFLDQLAQAKILRRLEPPPPPSQLGLAPPRAVWSFTAGGRNQRLEVGNRAPLGEGLYVRVGDQVALVPADLESTLLRPVDDFRLKTLVAQTTPDVQTLRLARAGVPALAFHRVAGEEWQVTLPYNDWGASEKVGDILDDIALCPVDSFAGDPPKDLKALGLDPAATDVTLDLKKGPAVEIRLGGPVPGSPADKRLIYAVVSGRPSLMTVSLNSLKSLDQSPEGLRSLALFRHDFYDAKELEVSGAATIAVVRGKDGAWQFKTPATPPKGADGGVIAGGVQALRGERAEAADNLAALGLSPPQYTLRLKGDGFEEKVLVGAEVKGVRYAKPLTRSAALPLPADAWKKLQEAMALAAGGPKAGP